ncbi:MAG: cupin domain-containing protein [Verrucomicrobiales bacterium]|nr:cupin domain-containing protein [Verrucomicrobiales bacterium]
MSLHPVTSHVESVHTLDVLGSPVRILLDGKQTHGAFALVELIGQPGEFVPPHVHRREEETFHVVEGALEIWCAGHTVQLRAGDTFFAPRNLPHSPKFVGNTPGRVLVTLTPAGFERAFRDLDSLAAGGPVTPEDAARVVGSYGCEFLQSPASP